MAGYSKQREDLPRVNDEITAREVRLIDPDGNQIGVVPLSRARDTAADFRLDLVEIAPQAKPPVCKIIDYGKYRYQLTKKQKDARKKQHNVQVKRLQFSPNIDDHDLNVKIASARKFIEAGHRVKVIIFMRGRQVTKRDLAEEVLVRVIEELAEVSRVESESRTDAFNNLGVVLVKKK